jgi:UDP-N-acetylglucosamine--N-acetylmuramyl-(pentapeptide) pyrophosphoryl-undecaprenol N-acetylglucosamine transferase
MDKRRVFISGGGTGGHLYPALVLGRALREADPGLEIVFIGSRRAAEQRILAAQNVRSIAMSIEGLKSRGLKSVRGLALLPGAFLKSLSLVVRLKPALVVGVGGYSSGPVVLTAAWLGRPTLIMEQNVRPGFTNRMLTRWVDRAVVAFDESLPFFRGKGVRLGNPVRDEFNSLPPRRPGPALRVLVFGGSQGSHVLNQGLIAVLPSLSALKDRLAFVHQTGPHDLPTVRRAYAEAGFPGAVVEPYFDDMPARVGWSDLVISRAGATTCAELIAAGRASILVPFAGAAEGHQAGNAAALAAAGGAEVLAEADLTPARLAASLRAFVDEPARLERMETSLRPLKTPAAAGRIAALCLSLMPKGREE